MINKKISVIFASITLAVLPAVAFAVACPTEGPGALNGSAWFQCVITNLLNIVVWPVFITVAIIMFIWAGILFLTAQGEPDKLSKARHAIIWGCVGIAVGLLGYVIVGVLRGALGL